MSQHTSGKLFYNDGSLLLDKDGNPIAQVTHGDGKSHDPYASLSSLGKANAARLCRAWNLLDSYDEMREALEELLSDAIHCDPHFEHRWSTSSKRARAILKKTGEVK